MSSGAEITVTPQVRSTFAVEIRAGGRTSTHQVVVPEGMAEALGWGEGKEADLVRESFVFLLAREPASSILPQFSLDVIGRYFPEYRSEMRRPASQ